MLRVNEKVVPFKAGLRVATLAAVWKPGADLFIVNGFPVGPETLLHDGDMCCLLRRGEVPPAEELEALLVARHTPGVHEAVKNATVGIMGLGGLGSSVAGALARTGIGRLLLADFDSVEPSNLNRQQYFVDQIGMLKTVALKENLQRMHPYVRIDTIEEKLTEESIPRLFQATDGLVECFDDPAMKAGALRAALTGLAGILYVGSSGVAGYGDNNAIRTRRLRPGVYIVGDDISEARSGQGLMAPRVGIAAHHQANQILRLLVERNRQPNRDATTT
jgi:sulfur carrier protein ThiS adenylyltransferase